MVTMAMLAWRWYQHSKLIQKLHGCEIKNSLPIRHRFWKTVNQPFILLDPLQRLAGEDGPGTVAEQPFQAGTVPRCDGDIGVEGQIGKRADLHG